jgi:hypothetical protein
MWDKPALEDGLLYYNLNTSLERAVHKWALATLSLGREAKNITLSTTWIATDVQLQCSPEASAFYVGYTRNQVLGQMTLLCRLWPVGSSHTFRSREHFHVAIFVFGHTQLATSVRTDKFLAAASFASLLSTTSYVSAIFHFQTAILWSQSLPVISFIWLSSFVNPDSGLMCEG